MNKNILPIAKFSDLVVQELAKETLVYNLKINKVMCLNPTSAYVWKFCNGKNDVTQILGLVEKEFNLTIKADFIWLALDELIKFDLIQDVPNYFENQISRRKVLLNYALPMAMFPLITGIIAPTAANAASPDSGGNVCNTGLFGDVCSMDSDCNLLNSGITDPMNTCDELGAGTGISCTVYCYIQSGCCAYNLAA